MLKFMGTIAVFTILFAMIFGLIILIRWVITEIKSEREIAKRVAIGNCEICAKCERELKPYELTHKYSAGYLKTFALCDDCCKELYGEEEKCADGFLHLKEEFQRIERR